MELQVVGGNYNNDSATVLKPKFSPAACFFSTTIAAIRKIIRVGLIANRCKIEHEAG